MNLALSPTGERLVAFPREKAKCPSCGDEVIAKCGEIKQWHWAHAGREDCDPWSEPESEWHLGWKGFFGKEYQEVVLPPHRADIKTSAGVVIELQHSIISPATIIARENFYKDMQWVVDAEPFINNLVFSPQAGYTKIEWKWFRKPWLSAKCPVYLDMRDGNLFQIVKINPKGGGYGHFIPTFVFLMDHKVFDVEVQTTPLRMCVSCGRNGTNFIMQTGAYRDFFCQICRRYSRVFNDQRGPVVCSHIIPHQVHGR